jgi:hypothetical protein
MAHTILEAVKFLLHFNNFVVTDWFKNGHHNFVGPGGSRGFQGAGESH